MGIIAHKLRCSDLLASAITFLPCDIHVFVDVVLFVAGTMILHPILISVQRAAKSNRAQLEGASQVLSAVRIPTALPTANTVGTAERT